MICVGAGSPVAVELHRMRGEDLCDTCRSAEAFRWFERVEMERFGHGETRRAFVAKVKREGARLRAEKAAAAAKGKVA